MEVRWRRYDYREVIGRVESGTETENRGGNCGRESSRDTYRDVGGRVMQEAITERRPRESQDAYKETCREALILQAQEAQEQ
jgi:hypothetical protein